MFLFTPLDECSTFSRALIFISFLCQLSPSFPRRVINTEMPPTHISRHSNSPSLFVSSSLSRSLPHAASSTPQIIAEKPAELHCEFIIIQLGFLNSHILSADGSNCETLSERTDHLCPNQKILSSLPLPLKANRWNCSYVHRQLAHSATIYLPYRTHSHAGKYACVSEVCLLLLIFSDLYESGFFFFFRFIPNSSFTNSWKWWSSPALWSAKVAQSLRGKLHVLFGAGRKWCKLLCTLF